MVAMEGETVSILCSTQSKPDPILTIFKEKQILATVIYESELQLELLAVTPEDDGEYWCVAENQYGQRATAFNVSVECEYRSLLTGDRGRYGTPRLQLCSSLPADKDGLVGNAQRKYRSPLRRLFPHCGVSFWPRRFWNPVESCPFH